MSPLLSASSSGHAAPPARSRTREKSSRIGASRRTSLPPFRHVDLRADLGALRLFHAELTRRIAADCNVSVALLPGEKATRLPPSADVLLGLERMLSRIRGSRPSDDWTAPVKAVGSAAAAGSESVTIDLCGSSTNLSGRVFRLLYDGVAGERGLFGGLIAGRMPVIEVEDVGEQRVRARGIASAENANMLIDAFDAVLARSIELLLLTLRGWESVAGEAQDVAGESWGLRELAASEARNLPHAIARRLYHLCCYAPHWRTCWRFVGEQDLLDTGTLDGTEWNVIPDPGCHFYADPFPFSHAGQEWLFIEELDHRTNKGIISVIPFGTDGPAGRPLPVLEEPWHLSYPFLFEHEGSIYMMPESSTNRSLGLYRADPFPYHWVRVATLLDGIEASDATMVQHGGRYWIFATTRSDRGSWSDTLSLYSAAHPLGPWMPHPGNPILIDATAARPAGAMHVRGGKLLRPVQDCAGGYGTGIGLVEVLRLDAEGYEQRVRSVLRPHPSWPGRRLHTLNRLGRIEVVDGSAHSPRSQFLAKRLEAWSGRRKLPLSWQLE